MYILYKIILFRHEKERNPVSWDDMDGPWGHYAKWDKPDRERQILYVITYMWNLKKVNFIETDNRMVVASGCGVRKWGDGGQRIQMFSYKKSKFWGSNVQHHYYS